MDLGLQLKAASSPGEFHSRMFLKVMGGHVGIMEKKMEAIQGLGFRVEGRDSGKENENYYYIGVILGLFWDNGKENGSYHGILG